MEIKTILAGNYEENCYILLDENSKDCAVIDPGGNSRIIISEIDKLKGNVKFILLTHGHSDHTGAVAQVRDKFNCPVYISEKDYEYIKSNVDIFGRPEENGDKFLKEGDLLSFGSTSIKCIETPGHTPGGLCFLIENELFTGDTLFYGSIGRTDFVGGDYAALIKGIEEKLLILPDNTVVYPGHGPKSSIGFERANNPYL